jgi:hypothetical protein
VSESLSPLTDALKKACEEQGLEVTYVTLKCEDLDFSGFPAPAVEPYNSTILLIDEAMKASPELQAYCYDLLRAKR